MASKPILGSYLCLAFCLLLLGAYSHTCIHDTLDHEIIPIDLGDPDDTLEEDRLLQTGNSFRVIADYGSLQYYDSGVRRYLSERLVPPVVDYFRGALKVKYPLPAPIRLPESVRYSRGCREVTMPEVLFTSGISADMVIVVNAVNEEEATYGAYASSCFREQRTQRPIIGMAVFNQASMYPADDPFKHERNMYTAMHEIIHALGFDADLFPYFLDAYGSPLRNIVSHVRLHGNEAIVVDVKPLTDRLRTHFGCSSIWGALMEDEGDAGSAGSHFEKRIFFNEVMGPNVASDLRISELTLALLEGSGWYTPDYTYAEPFFAGAGQGCSYYYGYCMNDRQEPNFKEYCDTTTRRRCANSGRSGAICHEDKFSNNCILPTPLDSLDCANPKAMRNAYTLTQEQTFSPDSACFEGTLNPYYAREENFCFSFTCIGSGLSTILQVMIGQKKVTCYLKQTVTVPGYQGVFKCPDPIAFCQTVGKKHCPRGCMGRGQCINDTCVCHRGYRGVDCSEPSYF